MRSGGANDTGAVAALFARTSSWNLDDGILEFFLGAAQFLGSS